MADGFGWLLLMGGAYLAYKGFKGSKEKATSASSSRPAQPPLAPAAVQPSAPPKSAPRGEAIVERYEPRLGRKLRPDECTLDDLERAFQSASSKVDVERGAESGNQRYEPALGRKLAPDEVSLEELEHAFQAADAHATVNRPERRRFTLGEALQELPHKSLFIALGSVANKHDLTTFLQGCGHRVGSRYTEDCDLFVVDTLSDAMLHSVPVPVVETRVLVSQLGMPAAVKSAAPRAMPNSISPGEANRQKVSEILSRPLASTLGASLAAKSAPIKRRGEVNWIPHGETLIIAGLTIPDGMYYLGDPGDPWSAPKCVINPSANVARSNPDLGGQRMHYWPSYSCMDPNCRLAYLQWLAGGRKDPGAYVGYVFLYFYGLERRLLKDRTFGEADAIVAEVKRLRSIYGTNNSFASYSADFLDAVDMVTNPRIEAEPPPVSSQPSYGLPIRLLLSLGHMVSEGKPLGADWMLAWMLAHPETRLRTPARRGFEEFCALFRARFAQKYPNGLKVNPPKKKIGEVAYRVASGDFTANVTGEFSDWPSVVSLTKPVNQAKEVAEGCMEELEAYSRFIGRSPDAKDSLQAKLLLPPELRVNAGGEVAQVLAWLGGANGAIPVEELLARLGITLDGDKIGKAHARAAAEALEGLGYGIEPDVRLGGRTPKAGEHVVLFRLPEGLRNQSEPGPAYQAATLTLGLCAVIAHADSIVTPEEERHLLALVETNLHLPPLDRLRLEAHARWLLAVPPSIAQLQSRLAGLPEERRHDLARFIIAVAAADGHVGVEEVKLLERLYKLLGLEAAQLFSDIHSFEASADEPVVVRPAGPVETGRPIPRLLHEEKDAQAVVLDMARIERIRADTAKVSSLLSEIFVEEGGAAVAPPAATEPADEFAAFDGLDRRHEALLRELASRPEWERGEFEQLCRSMDLLPGGALESLNEWAFERFDEAIAEDGDPVVVNLSLLEPALGPTP
jgi:uncharacterized tellurite resistance protein B-like protein